MVQCRAVTSALASTLVSSSRSCIMGFPRQLQSLAFRDDEGDDDDDVDGRC